MKQLKVMSQQKRQVLDITKKVARGLDADGIAAIHVGHTTAAITIMDLDPGTDEDFLEFLDSLVPRKKWRHSHNPDHAPDHLLASLIGPSVSVPFKNGRLQLGTWQRIVLVEFNGPRELSVSTSA